MQDDTTEQPPPFLANSTSIQDAIETIRKALGQQKAWWLRHRWTTAEGMDGGEIPFTGIEARLNDLVSEIQQYLGLLEDDAREAEDEDERAG